MSKKYLLGAGIGVFVVLLLAVFSVWFARLKAGENVLGHYVFQNTQDNIQQLRHIRMITPKTGEINIFAKDGVWYFKEAADYFVNTGQLSDFYYMVNNAIFTTVSKADKAEYEKNLLLAADTDEGDEQFQGTVVETYDAEEKLLDRVIIGSGINGGENRYARIEKYPYVYTISSVRGFSGEASAWIPFPLLEIPAGVISRITLGKTVLSMEALEIYLPRSLNLQKLIGTLAFLEYEGIAYQKELEKDFPELVPHHLEIETKVGLIYAFDIYKMDEESYFLAVKLKSTRIPKKEVPSFIKENQKYFAGWVFSLSQNQGRILYEIQAKDLFDSFNLY